MSDIIFAYDAVLMDWREIPAHPSSDGTSAQKQSPVFIVTYDDLRDVSPWEGVWCPHHHSYEKVIRQERDSLWTKDDCQIQGMCVKTNIKINPEGYNIYQHHRDIGIAYWMLSHDERKDAVRYLARKLYLTYTWERDTRDGRVRLVPHPRFWSDSTGECTTRKYCSDIPSTILDKIRTLLE